MVSICLATHNSSKTIRRTLSSILTQEYEDFELIIVDDHSIDDTCKIIETEFSDDRIKLYKDITDPNKPFIDAHNLSYKLATGKYLFRVDHDDILFSDFVKVLVEFMDENEEYDACSCGILTLYLDENYNVPEHIKLISETVNPKYDKDLVGFNKYSAHYFNTIWPRNNDIFLWHNNTSCIRKQFYDDCNPHFISFAIADVLFWRQVLSFGAKLHVIDKTLLMCLRVPNSTFDVSEEYNRNIENDTFIQYINAKYVYESYGYYPSHLVLEYDEDDNPLIRADDMKYGYYTALQELKQKLIEEGSWDSLDEEFKHFNMNYGYKDV